MYRPLRQSRYNDLILTGFQPFEARVLSKLPRNIPYLREMVAERFAEYKRAQKRGVSDTQFQTHILRRYNAKGWRRGTVRNQSSVWAMLRDTEKPYKEKHPDYVRGYPKKSHHRDGGKTANKLQGSLLDNYREELARYGGLENDRTRVLKEMIKRLEDEGG